MRGLIYLVVMGAKNALLELFRKPGKLIMYLLLLGLIVFMVLLPAITGAAERPATELLDLIWLKGILFAFFLLFMYTSIKKGLSNGDSLFEMNDVNLLFPSPVSPKPILLYGLVRMVKMAFLASFFILFQSNSLAAGFGAPPTAVLQVLLCFMLAMMFLSVLSLVIYSLSNGNRVRKRWVRIISIGLFAPLAVYTISCFLASGDIGLAAEQALRSPWLTWIPAAGWASQAAMSLVAGDIATGMTCIGVLVAGCAVLIAYVALGKADYYEDVLVATETAFERKRAVEDGQVNTEGMSERKIKVKKTGLAGSGASVLLFKHLRESGRVNPLGVMSWTSVVFIACAVGVAYFARSEPSMLLVILQILMWMQLFMIGTGRGLRETYMHYIYLIPQSAFSKMVWANLELVVKTLLESLLIFIPAGILIHAPLLQIIGSIAVYSLFTLLLIAINFASIRLTGTNIGSGLMVTLYILAVVILMAPGLVAAIILGGMFGTSLGLAVLAAWELLAGLGSFAVAKGALHKADMPVMPRQAG